MTEPYLKWAGGKTRVLPHIRPLFPESYSAYYEPFVGSAAVFLGVMPSLPVFLSDVNERLILTHRMVRDQVEDVINELQTMAALPYTSHYYTFRDEYNSSPPSPRQAALFIYLNKTGFNGLYRENRSGDFNIPMGRYANPTILNADRLRQASTALRGTSLDARPFQDVQVIPGGFAYLDPPYDGTFSDYAKDGFTAADQERLARWCRSVDDRGGRFLLSNADTERVRDLWDGFTFSSIQVARSIGSKASSRDRKSVV